MATNTKDQVAAETKKEAANMRVTAPVESDLTLVRETSSDDDDTVTDYVDMSLEELLKIKITLASRTEETAATSPSVVTVLTKSDIRRLGVRTLDELLNYVPGYQVTPETLQGIHSRVAVRGRSSSLSEHVLFLIDGQRINDLVYGSPSALRPRIAIENIKRVEVIRGPGSALYGSNAFMGVVNIVTNVDSSFIRGEMGSNWTASGSVKGAHDFGDLHVSGFARIHGDDGTYFRNVTDKWGTTGSVRDPYLASDFSLSFSYKGLNLNLTRMNREQGGYLMWDTLQDRTASDTTNFSAARLSYNADLSDSVAIVLSGQYSFAQWTSTGLFVPAGTTLSPELTLDQSFRAGPYLREHQMEFDAEVKWQIYKDNVLIGGISYGFSKLSKIGNYLSGSLPTFEPFGRVQLFFNENTLWNSHDPRHITGLYLQDKQTIADFLYLTAGVRADIYNDFGSTVNPRAALVVKTPIDSYLKLMYGRAFRAPTYSQLYDRANPVDRGNPDLDAENVDTYEAAYVQKLSQRLEATAAYYYYKITNAIVPSEPPLQDNLFGVPGWKNSGTFHAQGLEAELRAELFAGLSTFLTYSFTHGANFDLLVPAHSAAIALNYNYRRFNVNVSSILRSEANVPGIDDQGMYVLLNARLEYGITDAINIYLNMRNLTDNQYRTVAQSIAGRGLAEPRAVLLGRREHRPVM